MSAVISARGTWVAKSVITLAGKSSLTGWNFKTGVSGPVSAG